MERQTKTMTNKAQLPPEIAERIVTPGELSNILGISTERIRQLRHRGVFDSIEGARISYHFVDAVRGYLDFKRDELAEKKARLERTARVTNARAREIELRIAERMAKLMSVEDTKAIIRELVKMASDEFSALPMRAAAAGFSSEEVLDIEREISRSLARIKKASKAACDRLEFK